MSGEVMKIKRFLRQRGEDMTLEEIIEKSKEICKNQKEKGVVMLQD